MTSLRRLEANRENARRSTGPRTEEGKRQSRRNAVRHGLTAETVIEVLEDPEDYKGCKPQHQFALDCGVRVVIRDDGRLEGFVAHSSGNLDRNRPSSDPGWRDLKTQEGVKNGSVTSRPAIGRHGSHFALDSCLLKLINGLLMPFKRNQVEEAIARILEPGSSPPSSDMRTKLKRLLDRDRVAGRSKRARDPECAGFAFYSLDAPGRGVEVWFTEYEAFALGLGVRMMNHGWPQGLAVAVLRRGRKELETEHARILRQDPAKLFDQEIIRQRAKPGTLGVGTTAPVYLAITFGERKNRTEPKVLVICRGDVELMPHLKAVAGWSWSIFELVTEAHALSSALAKTQPSKRGRGSG